MVVWGGGGVTLTLTRRSKRPGTETEIDDPPVAPTELWRVVMQQTTGAIRESVEASLASVVGDVEATDVSRGTEVVDEWLGGIEGGRLAREVVEAGLSGASHDWGEALRSIIRLGRTGRSGAQTTLGDGRRVLGFLAFSGGDTAPSIRLSLPSGFWTDYHTRQRRRWLQTVADVATWADVTVTCSRLDERRVVSRHGETLPGSVETSVSGVGNDRTNGRPSCPSEVAGDLDDGALRVACVVADSPGERATFSNLYRDSLAGDVSDSGVRERVSRLQQESVVTVSEWDGDRYVVLTPLGASVVECVRGDRDGRPSAAAGVSGAHLSSGPDCDEESPSVSNPPNGGGVTVYSRRPESGEGPDDGRPATEGTAVTADSDRRESPHGEAWLPPHRHHAAAAAAPTDAGVSLLDERVDDSVESGVSISFERREVVVSVRADNHCAARTEARLAAALASDRLLDSLFKSEYLGDHLDEIADGNHHVMRLARCMGWLKHSDTTPRRWRERLRTARCDLLQQTAQIGGGQSFDGEIAGEVLRTARGLHGTLAHLLDCIGFDLVREVRCPEWSRSGHDESLARCLAGEIAVCSRFGHYPLFRTVVEEREEKREQMLGSPVIDPRDPTGETLGSWVLRGTGVSSLREPASRLGEYLDLADDDARNYSPFVADVEIADGSRREAVAEAATRLAESKSLIQTREAVSLFHGVTRSPTATAEALHALGSEKDRRRLTIQEVRYGLAHLPSHRLLPGEGRQGRHGLQRVLSALLAAPTALSGGDLADWADVSRQTVRNVQSRLQAVGLLKIEETEPGKANLYRANLPGKGERRDDDAPRPVWIEPSSGWVSHSTADDWVDEWGTAAAVAEVVARLGSIPGEIIDAIRAGRVDATAAIERWPEVAGLLRPVCRMIDDRDSDGDRSERRPPRRVPTGSVEIGERPTDGQCSLQQAVAHYGEADD